MRGSGDEAAAPKYAHVERERRWLVDEARCPLPPVYVLIEDRYIDGTRLRLRRMTNSVSSRIVLKLTKKYECDNPVARPIVTTYLSEAEYVVLRSLAARTLTKRRHVVGGFSVDAFDDPTGLPMIAEIECETDAALAEINAPDWTMCEVSNDTKWQCASLIGAR